MFDFREFGFGDGSSQSVIQTSAGLLSPNPALARDLSRKAEVSKFKSTKDVRPDLAENATGQWNSVPKQRSTRIE